MIEPSVVRHFLPHARALMSKGLPTGKDVEAHKAMEDDAETLASGSEDMSVAKAAMEYMPRETYTADEVEELMARAIAAISNRQASRLAPSSQGRQTLLLCRLTQCLKTVASHEYA